MEQKTTNDNLCNLCGKTLAGQGMHKSKDKTFVDKVIFQAEVIHEFCYKKYYLNK